MQQALAGEPLVRPWIGIRYNAIDLQVQKDKNLPLDHGAFVSGATDSNGQSLPAVVPGGPADKAGVRDGDIITSIEGQTIDSQHPLEDLLTQFAPGKTVSLEIYRDGHTITLQLTLGTRPSNLG
jgi:serine protease Do